MLLKAALPSVPGVNLLPGVRKTGPRRCPSWCRPDTTIAIDPAHVAAYARVCGFPTKDTVPLTYPHMLAFGLHMAIMTGTAFPFPGDRDGAPGELHHQHRPLAATEKVAGDRASAEVRPHAKGKVFDLVTEVHSGGELVWEETSTYLRRGKGDGRLLRPAR